MFRTMCLAVVLLGAASAARAEPELRKISERPASNTADAIAENRKDVASYPGVAEDTTRTLRVVDVDVVVPLLKGYRDLDGLPDVYRSMFDSMIPASMRLLDIHMHEDEDAVSLHDTSLLVHYEFFMVKTLESQRFDRKGWSDFRSVVASTLKHIDMSKLLDANENRVNAALDEHGVDAFRIDEMRTETPTVYRSDDRSLRLLATVSNKQTIEGKVYQLEEVRATANLLVKGRVVSVVAAREFRAGSARPMEVVAALDAFVDRILALNP